MVLTNKNTFTVLLSQYRKCVIIKLKPSVLSYDLVQIRNKWDRGSCLSLIPSSLEYINGTRLVKFGLFVDITPSI
jgi:hypothetical protein